MPATLNSVMTNGRAGTGPIAQSDRHAIIWADIYCLGLGVRSAPVSAQPQRDGLLRRKDHITLWAQDRDRAPIERHLRISSTCHPRHPNGRTRLTFIHHVFWQVRRDGHYCTYFFGHIAAKKNEACAPRDRPVAKTRLLSMLTVEDVAAITLRK